MEVLTVQGLCKNYPAFSLKDISFSLEEGRITGFIGRNGAGKTTTLKSLLNFVHPDSGAIRFFGKDFADNELDVKQKIGFVSGGFRYYPKKKLRAITSVTRRLYAQWDDAAYRRYLELFGLSEDKCPAELSEGMKVKYSLALSLSHNASLLLLDEPTSGLDPVSREELLDIFLSLVRESGVSIFFSTHITSDLEKCADDILYIRRGETKGKMGLEEFLSQYRSVRLAENPTPEMRKILIGCKQEKKGWSALIKADCPPPAGAEVSPADLDTIMVHLEKE